MSDAAPRRPAKMPRKHPRIAHFMPYLKGDSIGAITLAVARLFGWIDTNGQVDADGVAWAVHWAKWRKQWRWMATVDARGKVRHDKKGREIRVKAKMPHDHIPQLHTHEVELLRSRKRGGYRPRTIPDHMKACAKAGLKMAFEPKGSPGFLKGSVWTLLRAAAARTGVVMVVMTLQSIPGWQERLRLAHDAGFDTALLPRGPKPANWHEFEAMGTQVWGHWRKR